MPLDSRETTYIKSYTLTTIRQMDGDAGTIINSLSALLNPNKIYALSLASLSEIEELRRAMKNPHLLIGPSVVGLNGEYSTRNIDSIKHVEAVTYMQSLVKKFIADLKSGAETASGTPIEYPNERLDSEEQFTPNERARLDRFFIAAINGFVGSNESFQNIIQGLLFPKFTFTFSIAEYESAEQMRLLLEKPLQQMGVEQTRYQEKVFKCYFKKQLIEYACALESGKIRREEQRLPEIYPYDESDQESIDGQAMYPPQGVTPIREAKYNSRERKHARPVEQGIANTQVPGPRYRLYPHYNTAARRGNPGHVDVAAQPVQPVESEPASNLGRVRRCCSFFAF